MVCLSLEKLVFLIECRNKRLIMIYKFFKFRSVSLVLIISLFLTLYSLLYIPSVVYAQLEMAETYDIADTEAKPGDIISLYESGFERSKLEYDSRIFGVIIDRPLAVYRRVDGSGVPIARNGVVNINVTTANGEIKVGDKITTSILSGKGQKALGSGYTIGVALKDFKLGDGVEISYSKFEGGPTEKAISGSIPVAIKIEYSEISNFRSTNSLIEKLNSALFANIQDPEKFVNIIRYISSGIVGILSIIAGLLILSRVIPKGVEGIARNPMAKSSIVVYTALNVVVVIVIVFLGIGASLLLLRL